jgi:hypothetical protein
MARPTSSLSSLLLREGDRFQLQGTGVCCRATSCGDKFDARFVRGAASSQPPEATSALALDTTILVSSSARPRDDGEANVQMLIDAVRSAQRVLQLGGAPVGLIFDGLDGKPSVTRGIQERYAQKIRRTLAALPFANALVSDAWLHQANSMRCALDHLPRTRLLFVIQDDTQIGGGEVDTRMLHRKLLHDPMVEYIRFNLRADCLVQIKRGTSTRTALHDADAPCTPHPTSELLQRTHRWLDRPHFATRRHYEQRLFATLPRSAKVTPEQVLDQRSRVEHDWPLWLYGRRGDMARDLHWPQLVDGKLVAKEFIPELRRSGRNVTGASYAHSYLIHAYRGRTQDVDARQISKQTFRTHNPLAWTAEDGLTQDDLDG